MKNHETSMPFILRTDENGKADLDRYKRNLKLSLENKKLAIEYAKARYGRNSLD